MDAPVVRSWVRSVPFFLQYGCPIHPGFIRGRLCYYPGTWCALSVGFATVRPWMPWGTVPPSTSASPWAYAVRIAWGGSVAVRASRWQKKCPRFRGLDLHWRDLFEVIFEHLIWMQNLDLDYILVWVEHHTVFIQLIGQ